MPYDAALDLTTFTKISDTGGSLLLSVPRCTFTDLRRNSHGRAVKQIANVWQRNPRWTFIPQAGNGGLNAYCVVGNTQSDWYSSITRGIAAILLVSGSTVLAVMHEKTGTGNSFNAVAPNITLTLGAQYWAEMVITLTRADVFYYSDSALQNLVGSHGLNLSFTPDATWNNLFCASTLFTGASTSITGLSENYQLLTVAGEVARFPKGMIVNRHGSMPQHKGGIVNA